MKVQKILALLVAMGMVFTLESVLLDRLTKEDTASKPITAAAPSASPDQSAAPASPSIAPVTTLPPVEPGYTSQPGYSGTRTSSRQTSSNNDDDDEPVSRPDPTDPPYRPDPTDPPSRPDPTNPPAPTDPPAPPEDPGGDVDPPLQSSGSFSSDSGTRLNISVSWTAVDQGDGTSQVTISGSVSSYSLNVMALPVSISFGQYTASVTGNNIHVTDETLTDSSLFSTTMVVSSGMAETMTVTWQYNGTYSGTDLSEIVASGTVTT